MNLGEKYKKAWFDYMSNLDRETLPSLMDDKFEMRSLTKGPQKPIETKIEILKRISNNRYVNKINTRISPFIR